MGERVAYQRGSLLLLRLYSIKDDEQNLFIQPSSLPLFRQPWLLVREDIELERPKIEDIVEITLYGTRISDVKTITDIMNLYYKIGDVEIGRLPLPAIVHSLRVHSSRYPGMYYRIILYEPQFFSEFRTFQGEFWIRINHGEYVEVPRELALLFHNAVLDAVFDNVSSVSRIA